MPKVFSQTATMFLFSVTILLFTSLVLYSSAEVGKGGHYRMFKRGHVILGGLARLHRKNKTHSCAIFYPPGLGRAEAMIYAIEEINKNNSILPNLTLGYDIRDFCQDPVIAASNGYEFAIASTMNCETTVCYPDNKCICNVTGSTFEKGLLGKENTTTYSVAAIVGALTSGAAIPLTTFLQSVKIPLVDASATSEELSSSSYGNFFRTIPSDVNQAKAIADLIDRFGWRYAGIVAVDDSYGRHGASALERESMNRKFCVQLVGYIPVSNYGEKLQAIVSFFKERQTIRLIVLWSHSFQGRDLLIEAGRQKLKNRVWIFSEALSMIKPEFLPLSSGLSSTGIHLGVQMQRISSRGFSDYIKTKLTQSINETKQPWWKKFWITANSESYKGFTDDSCSKKHDTHKLLKMVHDDFVPYIIDAIYASAHALDRIFKCLHPNGSNIADRERCSIITPKVRPRDVIKYLKEVSFKGITGTIGFDKNGDPHGALYGIVYFKITKSNGIEKLSKEVIGKWAKDGNILSINDTLISWGGGAEAPSSTCKDECKPGEWKEKTIRCCWKCLSCPDGTISKTAGAQNCTKCAITQKSNSDGTECQDLYVTNVNWSGVSSIILMIIIFFGLFIDIFALVVFIHFRDTPIVKASSKVYSFVLLLGIALCFVMTFLYIAKPSSGLCFVLKPLRYIIYTLCCSALFLKTMQIVHAFSASRLKGWISIIIRSTKRQVILLSLILSIEILLGIGWIFLDPPYVHMTIIPKSHVFFRCLPYRDASGQVFDHLMLIYLMSMAGLCTYYAYRGRNLPANFNEAKYINLSLYVFLLSWITYYPIDYSLEGWYAAVLSAATILLSSYGLLGCIFLPKLYIIIQHPQKNTAECVGAEIRHSNTKRLASNASCIESSASRV